MSYEKFKLDFNKIPLSEHDFLARLFAWRHQHIDQIIAYQTKQRNFFFREFIQQRVLQNNQFLKRSLQNYLDMLRTIEHQDLSEQLFVKRVAQNELRDFLRFEHLLFRKISEIIPQLPHVKCANAC